MKNIDKHITLADLKACFNAFGSLLKKEYLISKLVVFDLENYQKIFSLFSDIRELEIQRASTLNIFELCSLERDEIRNCRVLAWLLDKNESHGLGYRFLEKLLLYGDESIKNTIFKDAFNSCYATRTEICPNADNTDRVDIVCESSKMLVYIEVKIDSSEHTLQTERYYKRLIRNSAGRQSELIFISANDTPINNNARNISWRQIGDIANELVSEAPSAFVAHLLEQYARFLQDF